MGLDAWVNCDCFEKGKLRVPPPFPEKIFIGEDGAPDIHADPYEVSESGDASGPGWEQIRAFDDWEADNPCEHERFTLLHHRIGNISLVGHLRALVADFSPEPAEDYPLVWNAVIYSGSHCGDRIDVETVSLLRTEIERLDANASGMLEGEEREYLKYFCEQMRELCEASLEVRKPIVF
jgi:hypothetical protein